MTGTGIPKGGETAALPRSSGAGPRRHFPPIGLHDKRDAPPLIIPATALDRARWQRLIAERGLECAAYTIADTIITTAPPEAPLHIIQAAIDAVLIYLGDGFISVALVPENAPTCYLIAGNTYALEARISR